jgi:hypothetical protein
MTAFLSYGIFTFVARANPPERRTFRMVGICGAATNLLWRFGDCPHDQRRRQRSECLPTQVVMIASGDALAAIAR